MSVLFKYSSLIYLFFLFCIAPALWAQQKAATRSSVHPTLAKIERAYENGKIGLDEKIRYKVYAGIRPDRVPESLRSDTREPVKCGTPALMEYQLNKHRLSSQATAEIEQLLSTPQIQTTETYLSESGKFRFHYETSGDNAVPADDADGNSVPDYVEQAALAADSTWRYQIEYLGFADPVLGPATPYNIYFACFNVYGQTRPAGITTEIDLHCNYNGFPKNTDPEDNALGALKVTMAHELKHAIQYVQTNWSGEADRWAEMDATLMEELTYDNVNDYYNYISSASFRPIFLYPERSFYPGSYEHITWALFFAEKYDEFFWVDVWDKIEQDNSVTMIESVSTTLEERGGNFAEAYVESQLWHFSSGPEFGIYSFGFEERVEYPAPAITENFVSADSLEDPWDIPGLAANYFLVTPVASDRGRVQVDISYSNEHTGAGFIGYFKNGSVDYLAYPTLQNSSQSIKTGWDWEDLHRIGIVISNKEINTTTNYRLQVLSTEVETFALNQNIPNPFNFSTSIPFSLPEAGVVELRVYNTAGRLVRKVSREFEPGNRNFDFEGTGLASGVYIYQVIVNGRVLSKKMTLIK